MPDPDDDANSPPKQRHYEARAADIEVRQGDEDAVFEVRMPIASTGEVRNEGDDPLTRDELEGMARQIGDGVVSVFPDHGQSAIGGPHRYSINEKAGEWQEAEVVGQSDTESGAAELVATARLMDPDTLPDIPIRGTVGTVKELVNRDMSIPSSIGWRDDDDAPGGVDLMEASMVGIPADPRTTSDAGAAVVARSAVEAGADPADLLAEVRAALREDADETRPFGPPGGDPNQWEDFDDCVADVEDWENIDDPEAFCAWAENQSSATTNDDMTDEETEQSADDADTEQDEQPDDERQAPEWAERLIDLQEQQMDTLEAIDAAIRQEDDDEMDDDEDEEEDDQATDEDEDEEEEDEEMSADEPDEAQDLREEIDALREELAAVRSGEADVETPEPDAEQDTETEPDEAQDADDYELTEKYGITH